MVALARTVYAGPDREPRALIAIATGGGRAAVERHLLDNLVAAVYTGRPAAPGLPDPAGRRHWGPGSAERYSIATPIVWISIWVSLALMWGLVRWLTTVLFAEIERLDELEAPPLDLLARDLWHGLVGSLTPGLFGLAVAFVLSAWGWHAISRAWLALRGQVPWRLMTFLDDAHRRGVLRQTGGTYQFRHILLQERLAIRPTTGRAANGGLPDAVQQRCNLTA